MQSELGLAVGALAAALGGVGAAVILQVQLAVPGGQVGAAGGLQVAEEVAGGALAGLRQAREARHRPQVLQHLAGRAAATVAVAEGHEHVALSFLLLEVLPGVQGRFRVGGRVISAGPDGRAAVLRRGAEMGQHAGAVQPLPPERVIGHAVVLVPAQLDGEEVVQAGLLDELRQRPGVAEDIRQPQHGRLRVRAEVLAEIAAPQQKLARQRLRAAQVAVGLNPHAADGLPAPLRHPRADRLEELWMILADVLVELGLALGEVVLGELLHQAQGGVEGARGFAAGLVEGPQPGHVDVGVAGGGHGHIQRRAGIGSGAVQRHQRRDDAFVEALSERLADVEDLERGVEAIEQPNPDGVVGVKDPGRCQGHARRGDELAGGLVDLHDRAGAHDGARHRAGVPVVAQASPALQDQLVRPAVGPLRAQQHLLVVAVARGVGQAVHNHQRLGMAEVARVAQRQVEGDGLAGVPIGGNLEGGA